MRKFLRLFTKKVLIILNVLAALIFLIAGLAPYVNPSAWWIVSILAYGFPFLLLTVVAFLIGWLFVKRRLAFISAIALLIGYKSIAVLLAFNFSPTFTQTKAPQNIRVLTWNVARFVELKKSNNKGSTTRKKMLELIGEQNADILCLQEFHSSSRKEYYDNITTIQKNLGFPYHYFNRTEDGSGLFYSSIIFSKYPIVDSGLLRYPRPTLPDVLLQADIKIGKKTIKVYTTRLQSYQLKKGEYPTTEIINEEKNTLFRKVKSLIAKLYHTLTNHKIQSDIIHQVMEDSPYPVVFCADLNDVPNSYAYHQCRGNKKDAFLEKGFGIGRTFASISPTLRIDYIFVDNAFSVNQFKKLLRPYSDHYMQVADISIN